MGRMPLNRRCLWVVAPPGGGRFRVYKVNITNFLRKYCWTGGREGVSKKASGRERQKTTLKGVSGKRVNGIPRSAFFFVRGDS